MSISSDSYFHHQLQRKTSVADAALLLADCARAFGWDLAAFHADIEQMELPRARDGEFIGTAMGWSAATVNAWVDHRLGRDCPIGLHCRVATEPFLWDCEATHLEWSRGRLPGEQQAVLHHYNKDVSGGVTVPVAHDGKTGYVSWCTRKRERLERGYDASLGSIHLISHTFIRQLDRIRTRGKGGRSRPEEVALGLTPRETECLTWAARGKTSAEIAQLLNRSMETVEFHLSNTMSKLGARTRTHAVAIACLRGLIEEI
jgi:LuxR family transcriptional regulator, quorum-sensing system regulator SdiA